MNKEQISEKKQIIEHVKARIDKGEPKQLILEDLTQLFKDKVSIVRQLELTPSKAMKDKYRMLNYLLAALLLASVVLNVIMLLNLFMGDKRILIIDFAKTLNVILPTVFTIGVFMYRIEIYSWIASSAVVMLVTLITSLYFWGIRDIDPLLFVSLGLILICFVLGLMLAVKLCPPRVPKIIEVDIDGVEKINKTIYVFAD